MADKPANAPWRSFTRICCLAVIVCAGAAENVCSAEQAETERLIKRMGPPPQAAAQDKISLDSYYEPGSVVEGSRRGRWSEVTNAFGYFHENIQGYLSLAALERFGERDYTTNIGSYLTFGDSYAHMEIGFGGDVHYIYHTQTITEFAHRLAGDVYWQVGYNYRSYSTGDSYTLYPGLIYYFGDNYLSADYGIGFIEARDTSQFVSVKGNFALTDTMRLWSGGAYGQRLYDIAGLPSRKECGYIVFTGITVKITPDIQMRAGVSLSGEAPKFLKRGLDLGITFKF